MAEKDLSPDIKTSYFKGEETKSHDSDIGTREMFPLLPFIISGGKNTERYYFKHISSITSYKFNIRPEYFGNESNYTAVFPDKIKEIFKRNNDARIYCVFDWDTIFGDKSKSDVAFIKHKEFVKKFKKEIKEGKIIICQSMPSFEYWFLLHFEDTTHLFKNYSQVSNRLAPYLKPCFSTPSIPFGKLIKSEKYLKEEEWVINLCKDDKLNNAILRAKNNIEKALEEKNLNRQSYTFVFRIFSEYNK